MNIFSLINTQKAGCQVFWYEDSPQFTSNIKCESNEILDLKQEFQNISNNLDANKKTFAYFYLNASVHEIPENVFIDIKFYRIFIEESNFTRIHSNAFDSTSDYTNNFWDQSSAPKLRNSPPDYNLYEAISSLVYLRYLCISLDSDTVHEIPDYAFGKSSNQQNDLLDIDIRGHFSISRIANYAFYNLPSIERINFEVNSIQYISAQAFDLQFSTNIISYIFLTNAKLDENCLESGVFRSPMRNIFLDLSIDSNI
jgi:hypothetical protein